MFKNAFLGALLAACFATAAAAGTISAQDSGMSNTSGQSAQTIYSGTPSANSSVGGSTQGATPGMFALTVSGTWSATLQLMASSDNGLTYVPWLCSVRGSTNTVTSITGNGTFDCPGGGVTNWLVVGTTFSSGSAVVTPFASSHEMNSGVGGGGGGGGAITAADCAIATIGCVGDTPYTGSGNSTLNAGIRAMVQNQINSVLADATSNSGVKGNPVAVNNNTACNSGVSGVAASNGTINKQQGDLLGNTCVRSVPSIAGLVNGVGTQTTLNTDTTIIAAVATKVIYVTNVHCSNTGATPFLATIKNNTAGSTLDQFIVPAGSGYVVPGGGSVLYATLSGDPLVFSMSASSTSGVCAASGFAQ